MTHRVQPRPNFRPGADVIRHGSGGFSTRYVDKHGGGGGGSFSTRREAAHTVSTEALKNEAKRLHALGRELERSGATDSKRYKDIRADVTAIRHELKQREQRASHRTRHTDVFIGGGGGD